MTKYIFRIIKLPFVLAVHTEAALIIAIKTCYYYVKHGNEFMVYMNPAILPEQYNSPQAHRPVRSLTGEYKICPFCYAKNSWRFFKFGEHTNYFRCKECYCISPPCSTKEKAKEYMVRQSSPTGSSLIE